MRRRMMLSLFVLMTAFTFNTTTFAQARPDASTPPPSDSSDNGERSNKGGQLRGLDRADQVAGQHGQQGREIARDAQLNRQTHPERSGVLERPAKPERSSR
jgi:hypothetical protein